MSEPKRTSVITTPIYYVNDVPHVGHAYTTIAADTLARARRLAGEDVFFLTGTDEHGQNIERIARERGISEQEHCDRISAAFRALWGRYEVRYDGFIRTTDELHRRGVLKLWERLRAAKTPDGLDAIYRGRYSGWYCPQLRELQGRGRAAPAGQRLPRPRAAVRVDRGGELLLPSLRLPGVAARDDRVGPAADPPRLAQERDPGRDPPGPQGLQRQPRAREVGHPGPRAARPRALRLGRRAQQLHHGPRLSPTTARRTAATGRAATSGCTCSARTSSASTASTGRRCCTRPACPCRRASSRRASSPRTAASSRRRPGNVIDPVALVEQLGPDAARYFLLREAPYGADWDFTDAAFVGRYNADLANDLGNLVSRALTMAAQVLRRQGAGGQRATGRTALREPCRGLRLRSPTTAAAWPRPRRYEAIDFAGALVEIWSWVEQLNQAIVQFEPWTLAKDPARQRRARGASCTGCSRACGIVAVLVSPVMPRAAARIFAHARPRRARARPERPRLGTARRPGSRSGRSRRSSRASRRKASPEPAPVAERRSCGRAVRRTSRTEPEADRAPAAPAKRVRKSRAANRRRPPCPRRPTRRLRAVAPRLRRRSRAPTPVASPAPAAAPAPPAGDRIDIAEFAKVELRAAKVTAAEKIAGSKKLIKLQVDLGSESAPGRGGDRRDLRARGARREDDRAGREPQAREADGRRVERHGPGRLDRRQGRAVHVRGRGGARHEGEVKPACARADGAGGWARRSGGCAFAVRPAARGAGDGRRLRPGSSRGRGGDAGPRTTCCASARRPRSRG